MVITAEKPLQWSDDEEEASSYAFSMWPEDEEEASSYAFSVTVKLEQTWIVSINMAENNHDNDIHQRMEAQEQTFRAQ